MGFLPFEFLSGVALGTLMAVAGPTAWALGRGRRTLAGAAMPAADRAGGMDCGRWPEPVARHGACIEPAPSSRALATVSHEIRTPLGGILGVADLLAATPLTAEQQSYVAAVKTSGGALMTLLDDVLDLARIEAGRLDLARAPFEPVALIEGVVELLAPRAHEKGLDVASFVATDVPARLIGDVHRLRQVLLNLAGNAIKFTATGGVGLALQRCPDGRVVFSVSDTGPGISASRRTVVFEAFERAEAHAEGREPGSGLGLAIVKRIVADMGGELGLADRAGGGTLFAIRIALEAAEADGSPLACPEPGSGRGSRSLVVSPGAFQAAYLDAMLRGHGGDVVRVTSSIEAVASLQRAGAAFDTVYIDCALGDDAARTVAAVARLGGARRTVLMFSPHERRLLPQSSPTGFDAWLVKPVRRASLAARLEIGAAGPSEPERPVPRAAAKVLLAEDNPISALVARACLERLGSEVVLVADGESACRVVEAAHASGARPFDVVLMDLSMPLLGGLDAARRIRDAERLAGRPPVQIVATTAHAFQDTRLACRRAGIDEVLTKPIEPAQLRRLVETATSEAAGAVYDRTA